MTKLQSKERWTCRKCGTEVVSEFDFGCRQCPACGYTENSSISEWIEKNTIKDRVADASSPVDLIMGGSATDGKEPDKPVVYPGKVEFAAAMQQPGPTTGRTRVLDLVLTDLRERTEMGTRKYGTPLMTYNGRNALWDAYQEALDLVMYLRQAITELRDGELAQVIIDETLYAGSVLKNPEGGDKSKDVRTHESQEETGKKG